jgi:hypothetical protein
MSRGRFLRRFGLVPALVGLATLGTLWGTGDSRGGDSAQPSPAATRPAVGTIAAERADEGAGGPADAESRAARGERTAVVRLS